MKICQSCFTWISHDEAISHSCGNCEQDVENNVDKDKTEWPERYYTPIGSYQ